MIAERLYARGALAALANTVDVWRAICERFQATKMKKLSKIKQGFRTLIKKQLSLVNGQLGAEYLVIFPNINVTSNWLKSVFCLSCKKVKMALRAFWHSTVDMRQMPFLLPTC